MFCKKRLSWSIRSLRVLIAFGLLLGAVAANAQLAPGSMDVHWDEGAADCSKNAPLPLQVHAYNASTYILRENLCATFEAPFLYLLIGSDKALLIDTGDVADPQKMSLAKTVLQLLSHDGRPPLPLLVVHSHRHLDHRAGDVQFAGLPNVQVVGYDLDGVKQFFHFTDWPNGVATIDLGGRTVDAIPTPGHSETEVSYYDRQTGLLFSGDFFMPARLLIDDTKADLASANRIVEFVKDKPVSYALGGHIEMNDQGQLFDWESQYHPHEHVLQMTKAELLGLPATIESFNGVYSTHGQFVMMNQMRVLAIFAGIALLVLVAVVMGLIFYVRRRRRRRLSQA